MPAQDLRVLSRRYVLSAVCGVTTASSAAGCFRLTPEEDDADTGDDADADDSEPWSLEFEWSETIVPEELYDDSSDTRSLAFACQELVLYEDTEGQLPLIVYEIGDSIEPEFETGVYGEESGDDLGRFRWFGGESARTRIVIHDVEREEVDGIGLSGSAQHGIEDLSATVQLAGETVATVDLETSSSGETYLIEL